MLDFELGVGQRGGFNASSAAAFIQAKAWIQSNAKGVATVLLLGVLQQCKLAFMHRMRPYGWDCSVILVHPALYLAVIPG